MKCIVYVSSTQHPFSDNQLHSLAVEAGVTNHIHGVTGYLFYQKSTFIQYIEAEGDKVFDLMSNIRADPRHRVIFELEGKPIEKRRFPNWDMKYISRQEMSQVNLEKMLADALILSEVTGELDEQHIAMTWSLVDRIAQSGLD